MNTVLSVLALLLGLVALTMAILAFRRTTPSSTAEDVEDQLAGLPADARALREEVAALRAEHAQTLQHLAVVRYDAFPDMGGQLSWSLALCDDVGSGVLLTSITGRHDARTYAKSLRDWASEAQLSPEESEAVGLARSR